MEAKEQHEKVYIERAKAKSIKNKVTASSTMERMDSTLTRTRPETKMMKARASLTTL